MEIKNKVKYINVKDLKLLKNNPRKISKDRFEILKKSIKDNSDYFEARPLIVSNRTNELVVIAGNQRLKASIELGLKQAPCVILENLTEEKEKEIIVRDNVELGQFDIDLLSNQYEIGELESWGVDIEKDLGIIEKTQKEKEEEATNFLKTDFIFTPFSIIDTTQKTWQERKNYWKILIKNDGESREEKLFSKDILKYRKTMETVSIFDPCLAELIYKFFTPYNNCNIFDTFAGGASGYVFSYLGANFTGIELREEQTKINNDRIKEFKNSKYICDDGCNIDKYLKEETQDLFFSCPPYFNLEKYSDLKNDASNQDTYEDFLKILEIAFTKAIKILKNNRFAIIVMSDIRDKKGNYIPICSDIINIFLKNGCFLYNELILANSIGTLPVRVRGAMKNRKLGRRHQEVLCFYKGAINKIQETFEKNKQIRVLDERVLVFLKGNIDKVNKEFEDIKDILVLDEEDLKIE